MKVINANVQLHDKWLILVNLMVNSMSQLFQKNTVHMITFKQIFLIRSLYQILTLEETRSPMICLILNSIPFFLLKIWLRIFKLLLWFCPCIESLQLAYFKWKYFHSVISFLHSTQIVIFKISKTIINFQNCIYFL